MNAPIDPAQRRRLAAAAQLVREQARVAREIATDEFGERGSDPVLSAAVLVALALNLNAQVIEHGQVSAGAVSK